MGNINSIILTIMFVIFAGCRDSSAQKCWFFTKIFDFESISIDQAITNIYLHDENIGFLFGSDQNKVLLEGLSFKDQSILFYRSSDGGKTFEKQILGRGMLEFFSRSANDSAYYIAYADFSNMDSIAMPNQYRILKSSDLGKSWNNLSVFRNKVLGEVLFFDDYIGFAVVSEDPIGYNKKTLYKTIDGGAIWEPTSVNIDNLVFVNIGNDRKIIGQYVDEHEMAVWKMDIDSLQIEKINLQVSPDYHIYGLIETDRTKNEHYLVLESQKKSSYSLYNIEKNKMIDLPNYIYAINIYGDFIGILSYENGKAHKSIYSYTIDKGKSWKKETPPDSWLYGSPGMYGMGYVWVTATGNADFKYPLLVRTPCKFQ